MRISCDNNEALKQIAEVISTQYLSIFLIKDEVFLKSKRFEECKEAVEVLAITEELLKTVLGVMVINSSLTVINNIKIDGVIDKTNAHHYFFGSDYYDLNCSIVVPNQITTRRNPFNDPNRWFNLIERDDSVKQVTEYSRLGLGDAFVMYGVFELIREDVKKDFTKINVKYSRGQMSSFTGSLNDPRVLGEDSRHAVPEGKKEMTKTMSKSECHDFITELLHEWIHYKLNIYGL
ncbi:hypothetical protein [Paenibacillus odorifer]|uniref:Uncharacterized protein n=1 Tax=Paenibacillus odorifer TaxID=189426 RepID=A0AAD0KL25_9BACL|nr:hypothetical protein [Paenibacillus odorifer]AWV35165.1 hypothetical protein CD191_22410 [Paenibacillus odorifer]